MSGQAWSRHDLASPAATGSGILPPRHPATVTRHLSVGAFVDEVFAANIVREVLNQPRRQVAPAYGFDLIAMLGQCRRALRLNLIRDWVLTGSLIVGLCLVVPALQAISFLVGLQLTISSVRLLRDAALQIRAGSAGAEGARLVSDPGHLRSGRRGQELRPSGHRGAERGDRAGADAAPPGVSLR